MDKFSSLTSQASRQPKSSADSLDTTFFASVANRFGKVAQVIAVAITCSQEYARLVVFAEHVVLLGRQPRDRCHRRFRRLRQKVARVLALANTCEQEVAPLVVRQA